MKRTTVRNWLHHRLFYNPTPRLATLRPWALVGLTAYLALVWKWLTTLEKVYPDAFWQAVFGPSPAERLGFEGLVLLIFYAIGAILWGAATLGLAAVGKEWAARLFSAPKPKLRQRRSAPRLRAS